MTLTLWEIYQRYSDVETRRKVYLKRTYDGATYETNYIEAPNMEQQREGCVGEISLKLSKKGVELGSVQLANCEFEFNNFAYEWSDEANTSSIFNGYQRHYSKIKVVDSYLDKYTNADDVYFIDESNGYITAEDGSLILFGQAQEATWVDVDTAEFLIDDRQAVTTFNDTEKFIGVDLLTVLDKYRIREFTLAQTTINTVVYEILNRSQFTSYFNVSNSTTYINAGYNATSLDMTKYADSTVLECFQDLAKGHSIFYVKDGYFYFVDVQPSNDVKFEFTETPERRLNLEFSSNGSENVIEKYFWSSSTESYTSGSLKYFTSIEFDVKGVTNTTQRQNLLNNIGARFATKKPLYTIDVPLLPSVRLLDKIKLSYQGLVPFDAFVLGQGVLGVNYLRNYLTSTTFSYNDNYIVREISHTASSTKITIEKI